MLRIDEGSPPGAALRPQGVLLVEDDEDDYLLTRTLLRKHAQYELEWASSYDEGLERITAGGHEAYLIDFRLGARSGVELIREARRRGCVAPLLLLTGQGDAAVDAEALRAGAADYLDKHGLTPSGLERAIRYSIVQSRALEELRLFRAAFEQTREGVALTEAKSGVVVYANHALSLMASKSVDELVGRDLAELLSGDAFVERRRQSQTAGTSLDAQTELRAAGSARPTTVEWSLTPLRNEHGVLTHFAETQRDVSEQRQLKAHLLASERMTAIAQLAGGLAHEMNNPLAWILANLRFVRDELMSNVGEAPAWLAEVMQALEDAGSGAERLRRLVLDIRSLSQSDADHIAEVDLDGLITRCVSAIRLKLMDRATVVRRVARHADGKSLRVRANEADLGQVLLQILGNAAQAIVPGAASENRIEITGRSEAGRVVIDVKDTGCGLPAGHERLFEPFFSAWPSGLRTGLGLFVVRTTLARYGGTVDALSPSEGGALFRLTLPADP